MPEEDVVHVLSNVHEGVVPEGLVLEIHPLGIDLAVRAGSRGIGFVDSSRFALVVEAMDGALAGMIEEGLFADVRSLRRHVVERFDNAAELIEEADGWENLRLPSAVRRRLEATDASPVELVDAVAYRLLRRL